MVNKNHSAGQPTGSLGRCSLCGREVEVEDAYRVHKLGLYEADAVLCWRLRRPGTVVCRKCSGKIYHAGGATSPLRKELERVRRQAEAQGPIGNALLKAAKRKAAEESAVDQVIKALEVANPGSLG